MTSVLQERPRELDAGNCAVTRRFAMIDSALAPSILEEEFFPLSF